MKISFWYLLVLYVNFSVKSLNLFSYFQPILAAISCYHSNGKSQIDTRLLHLGYCSNELIRSNFYLMTSRGGVQNRPSMHVAL